MKRDKDIIDQAAKDYDMSSDEVQRISDNTESSVEFYRELESFIKNRRKNTA